MRPAPGFQPAAPLTAPHLFDRMAVLATVRLLAHGPAGKTAARSAQCGSAGALAFARAAGMAWAAAMPGFDRTWRRSAGPRCRPRLVLVLFTGRALVRMVNWQAAGDPSRHGKIRACSLMAGRIDVGNFSAWRWWVMRADHRPSWTAARPADRACQPAGAGARRWIEPWPASRRPTPSALVIDIDHFKRSTTATATRPATRC